MGSRGLPFPRSPHEVFHTDMSTMFTIKFAHHLQDGQDVLHGHCSRSGRPIKLVRRHDAQMQPRGSVTPFAVGPNKGNQQVKRQSWVCLPCPALFRVMLTNGTQRKTCHLVFHHHPNWTTDQSLSPSLLNAGIFVHGLRSKMALRISKSSADQDELCHLRGSKCAHVRTGQAGPTNCTELYFRTPRMNTAKAPSRRSSRIPEALLHISGPVMNSPTSTNEPLRELPLEGRAETPEGCLRQPAFPLR